MQSIILPTAYFPPISWWVIFLHYRTIEVENFETYPKQTYRNRCHIYTANGILPLSIPVTKVDGNHTLTEKVQTDISRNWKLIHWRTLEAAYNKAPYFLYYKDPIADVFNKEEARLVLFNHSLIEICAKLLKIKDYSISPTRDFIKEPEGPDYRQLIHPKKDNPLKPLLESNSYNQVFGYLHGFIPDLSILDLLFNEGPDALRLLETIRQDVPWQDLKGIRS